MKTSTKQLNNVVPALAGLNVISKPSDMTHGERVSTGMKKYHAKKRRAYNDKIRFQENVAKMCLSKGWNVSLSNVSYHAEGGK